MNGIFTLCCFVILCCTAAAQAPRTILDVCREFNDTTEYAVAQAMDNAGNLYVAGYIAASGYNKGWLARYDAAGTRVWERRLEFTNFDDIEADAGGNIYVSMREYDTVSVAKFDSNGNLFWRSSCPLPAMTYIWSKISLAVDPAGNVFACGPLSSKKLFLVKFDSHGQLKWVEPGQLPGKWDWFASLRCDAQGNAYVAGALNIDHVSTEFTLAKFSPSGELVWLFLDQGTFNWPDHANDLELDAQGNIYVAGLENYQGEFMNSVTMKIDSNGNLIWKQVYNNSAGLGDEIFDVLLGKDGSVYVSGAEDRDTRYSTTIKYDNDGNYQWKVNLGDTSHRIDLSHMGVDAEGNLVVAGLYSYLGVQPRPRALFAMSINHGGNINWLDTCFAHEATTPVGLNIHPQGGAYVTVLMSDSSNSMSYGNVGLIRYETGAVVSVPGLITKDERLDIFPNPAKGMITLRSQISDLSCMEIMDISGRIVKREKCNNASPGYTVDLSSLPSGTYSVRAVGSREVLTKRVVLVH